MRSEIFSLRYFLNRVFKVVIGLRRSRFAWSRVKSGGCRASAAADANLLGGVWHRRPTSLNQRGWRMLEDACAKKRRLNPAWGQRRNFGKLNGRGRCADKWYMSNVLVTPRRDQRNHTNVFAAIRIRVNARVQLRRDATEKCPRERCENDSRDESACAAM